MKFLSGYSQVSKIRFWHHVKLILYLTDKNVIKSIKKRLYADS